MDKLLLIGSPLSHSLSPYLHNYWLQTYGHSCIYELCELKTQDLECFIKFLPKSVKGMNVTLPYKKKIIPYLDEVTQTAERLQAVNTIYRSEGKLIGDNTDYHGFLAPIKNKKESLETVLILGAGGASYAVGRALSDIGVKTINIWNRTQMNAESLAKYLLQNSNHLECRVLSEKEIVIHKSIDMLVNTTSIGLSPDEMLPINFTDAKRNLIVYDLIYNPLQTKLLNVSKQLGFKTVNGLEMFLVQAQLAFERWFGVKPEIDEELRQYIMGKL